MSFLDPISAYPKEVHSILFSHTEEPLQAQHKGNKVPRQAPSQALAFALYDDLYQGNGSKIMESWITGANTWKTYRKKRKSAA